MEYRRLGRTGLEISTIGLGTNNFGGRMDYDATKKVLNQTMEEGINFIDCANTYGGGKSEEFIGKALGKEHRHDMIIATKVGAGLGPPGTPITGPNQRGATRHLIMEAGGAEPEAAEHGLHRPVLHAPLGRGHAHRGDSAGAGRPGAQRQGALPGLLQLHGVADGRGHLGGPRQQPVRLLLHTERVQPGRP